MRLLSPICPLALLSPVAHAGHGWGLGVQTGVNWVQGPNGTWDSGPSFGLQLQRALPSGAEWRFLLRSSPIRQRDGAGTLVNSEGQTTPAPDAISIHNHLITGLRYSPLPWGSTEEWAFGPQVEAGFGLNVLRTHTDLATPTGLGRITNTESALLVQAGLGLRSTRQHTLVIDAGLSGQVFATFDRGERGGGDRLGVFFGLLPGVELSGQF